MSGAKSVLARHREKVLAMLAAVEAGATDKSAAAEAGISRQTLHRWRHGERPSDVIIRERLYKARAVRERRWLKSIQDASVTPTDRMPTGDWKAASWLLERTNREFGVPNRLEIGGVGGGPVQISESVEHRLALPDKERVVRVLQLLQDAGKMPLLETSANGNGNGHEPE